LQEVRVREHGANARVGDVTVGNRRDEVRILTAVRGDHQRIRRLMFLTSRRRQQWDRCFEFALPSQVNQLSYAEERRHEHDHELSDRPDRRERVPIHSYGLPGR
jgi:hypothetical protein